MLRKTLIAGLAVAAISPAVAVAGDAPPPEHTITGNVGLFSQYIFRGLTQTNRDPALQGGFDYAHSSGLYAGAWGSNISWLRENATVPGPAGVPIINGTYGEGGSLELDFYGGYKMSFGDFGLDLGTLYYWYPGKTNPLFTFAAPPFNDVPKANTWEIYLGGSWKWIGTKFSYSLMDKTFGVKDSDGTFYLDVFANVPLGDFMKPLTGLTLNLHWGWQKYSGTDPRNVAFSRTGIGSGGPGAPYPGTPDNDELFSYKDIKVGLTYALPKDFTIGAFYSKVYDYNKLGYGGVGDMVVPGFFGPFPRNVAKGTGTVFVQKTF